MSRLIQSALYRPSSVLTCKDRHAQARAPLGEQPKRTKVEEAHARAWYIVQVSTHTRAMGERCSKESGSSYRAAASLAHNRLRAAYTRSETVSSSSVSSSFTLLVLPSIAACSLSLSPRSPPPATFSFLLFFPLSHSRSCRFFFFFFFLYRYFKTLALSICFISANCFHFSRSLALPRASIPFIFDF